MFYLLPMKIWFEIHLRISKRLANSSDVNIPMNNFANWRNSFHLKIWKIIKIWTKKVWYQTLRALTMWNGSIHRSRKLSYNDILSFSFIAITSEIWTLLCSFVKTFDFKCKYILPFFCNSFLRKGKVGSYRDELNEEQIQKLDDWTEEAFKNSDFKFIE